MLAIFAEGLRTLLTCRGRPEHKKNISGRRSIAACEQRRRSPPMRLPVLVLTTLGFLGMNLARADDMRVTTAFGTLTIDSTNDKKCAVSGGRQLYCTEEEQLTFPGRPILLQNYTVVFLDEDCGGSACGIPSTRFIVQSANNVRYQAGPFEASWSNGTPRRTGPDSFSIALPYFDGKIRSMTFVNGEFTFEARPAVGPLRLTGAHCESLYRQALRECSRMDAACAQGVSGLSMANQRLVNGLRGLYQRFQDDEFEKLCEQACTSKRLPVRANFNRAICRHRT
ncbi:hypothetical protein [Phreatobacter stygius]|uniref:Uncharacterized protein n=1 Tax=Phreatobacter stygius TaxID=1940610 RepID=A0A4D7BI64_9HYPH|nr:hypothetical protein [Phreatobacter stygius]QCI67552.1 hypothetical protein E8M01_27015 [Phreatobacter stygius]